MKKNARSQRTRHGVTSIFLTMLFCTFGIKAMSHDIEVKNADGITIYYNFTNNGELTVTYKGGDRNSFDNEYVGDVVIPESVIYNNETYSVTVIVNSAFEGCSRLTSVKIPNSVTSIGERAFFGCIGLTSITIPNSVTTIGKYVFERCSSLTSVTIPNSVTIIDWRFFSDCSSLTSITIPNSVTEIGYKAFSRCSSLTSITIPNSVNKIQYKAFEYCNSITSVTIGNGVKDIETQAFQYLNNLKDVYCYAEEVPGTMGNVFENSPIGSAALHVPAKSVSLYKQASPWSSFNKIIAIGETTTYQLTYKVDGEVFKTYTLEEGATITPEPAPTKEGYTFSGWSEIPATMPAHDVTITGTFTINKYKLTYKVDGEVYKQYDIEYGASITPETAPTKEGYTFSGWSDVPSTMPAHDVTVTGTFAKVEKHTYQLTYMVDGEVFKSYALEEGKTITPEAAPTKEGYTFSGWSEIPGTMPSHDVTVTGTFTVNKYTLTYKVDGEVYKQYTIEYGATITPEAAPTKEGYTFSGWSEIPSTMPANDVTVTGTFSKATYNLIYKVDGEVYKTYQINVGESITPEPAPTKEGYTFSGWSEIPETMPAHDVTITGTFTVNKYKLTYKVDGGVYKQYDIEYGASITPETAPTKEGYTFSGWSEIPSTMPANDLIISGTFTINTYKLTYTLDGEVYKTYDIEYGASITPEVAPTKEGYTFSGWSYIPSTMPAHDVTVTGTFAKVKKNTYQLTYMVDGEVFKSYTLEEGASITPEAAPTKEGYTFSGWSDIPTTMPAHDVTVTGTFTVNKYTLTYKVDGEVYKQYTIEYGATITPEAAPTKEGYTFSGWSDIPSTMPARDVTITGTFKQVDYNVGGTTYEISGEGTVTVKGGEQTGSVEIAGTVVINGQTYNVTAVAENAFKDNTQITSVTIADGITTIGDNAFRGCVSLLVINIGKDITSIGNKAFANVGSSSAVRTRAEKSFTVNCYAESVPQTAYDTFENSPIENGSLLVVDSIVDAYKTTSPWNKFGKIQGFQEAAGINSINIDSANARIYDIQGNRIENLQKGVNIIRMENGKTKKIIVK